MNLTLHLTNQCNLCCSYCFVERGEQTMSAKVADAAIRFGMEDKTSSGLLFYGGEPLVAKERIYHIIEETQKIRKKTGHSFYYKMTTNGTLLDEDFLKLSKETSMSIGFSHDGPAQDVYRLLPSGEGTFSMLEEKIPLLLKYQPYAIGMCVLNPSTANKASAIVQFLFDKGFRYITVGMNYDEAAGWTKEHLLLLEEEYKKMAEMYFKWTKAEEKFYLSSFDMKILSHLQGENYNQNRKQIAKNQLSVGPDGKLYASSKHVGTAAFEIGDVFNGIDEEKQQRIHQQGFQTPESCAACGMKHRCNYSYGGLRYQEGKIVSKISPVQCMHEQILTPIADRLAERLYKEGSALFMHKHYNERYAMLSLLENTT